MAEVIHLNYTLLNILARFGIRLGFGEKTVEQVCQEYEIQTGFFLEVINSFNDKTYKPGKNPKSYPVQLIIDYLRKSHEYYLSVKIPQIELLISKLAELSSPADANLWEMAMRFFAAYKKQLIDHIEHEEEVVYPYVVATENSYNTQEFPIKKLNPAAYSIGKYAKEHNNIEDQLFDLKNIIIKYLPLPSRPELCQTLLEELFKLESDLNDHARIEDKVLVPRVKFLEKWLQDSGNRRSV